MVDLSLTESGFYLFLVITVTKIIDGLIVYLIITNSVVHLLVMLQGHFCGSV